MDNTATKVSVIISGNLLSKCTMIKAMKRIPYFLKAVLASILTVTCSVSLTAAPPALLGPEPDLHIAVNNKILAKVNGTAISVMDVMKKMDMLFFKQFPQYSSSVQARFQFYNANWKHVLNELIDKELILADAAEIKITVTQGDVRQEVESLFGPNIIINLDKAGLTLAEASKMVEADITLRRMMFFRVHSKALNQVTPQVIRKYYDDVAKDHIRDNEWIYSFISIRDRNSNTAAEKANLAHHLLVDEKVPLDGIAAKITDSAVSEPQTTVTVSEEFHTKEKDLSEAFRMTLSNLQPNSYTAPIAQKSRTGGGTLFRIFYLNKMIPGGVVPYQELEGKIKDMLLDKAIGKESEAYLKRLRQHFDVQESQLKELLSSDFQPFTLQ